MLLAILLGQTATFAQRQDTVTDPKLATEVEQAIRNFYRAFVDGDHEGVDSFIVDEGFFYDPEFNVYSGTVAKARLKYAMDVLKMGSKYSFEFSDFTFAFFGSDVSVANYREEMKSLADPNDITILQVTDTLVRRNGKWQILVDHTSEVPKAAEPIIAGLPVGWRRNPESNVDRFTIGVDTSIKHSGHASASLKRTCGNDGDSYAALQQPIAADDYRGKRIRLTGWLKTSDVSSAALWMRVDSDRTVLAFDNMENRFVKGTSDWKMYSLVLDVPVDAKNIWIGALLSGKGQTWVDDFKLEVVDETIASTNSQLTDEMKKDRPELAKYSKETNKHPVNLGFEGGTVH